MSLFVHPVSDLQIKALEASMPQSLLLAGVKGVGLKTIALKIAGAAITDVVSPADAKGEANEHTGTISVDAIRRLYTQTRAKRTGRQVIIIDDADRMSPGAQAAFLKLLEEPNPTTYFILTSHHPQQLLSTVRSRVQQITIQPITSGQSADYIASLGVADATKKTQLLFIATGLPAQLRLLVEDSDYFAMCAKVISDARSLLQLSPYNKLCVVQKYQSDRTAAIRLIDTTMHLLRHSLSNKPQVSAVAQLTTLLQIRDKITAQGNVRLQLARFVL